MQRCQMCNKRRDDMALVTVKRIVDESAPVDEWVIAEGHTCVWCLQAEAYDKELYPDSDNLVGCPRCGNDILRNQGVCRGCMDEVNAYYR